MKCWIWARSVWLLAYFYFCIQVNVRICALRAVRVNLNSLCRESCFVTEVSRSLVFVSLLCSGSCGAEGARTCGECVQLGPQCAWCSLQVRAPQLTSAQLNALYLHTHSTYPLHSMINLRGCHPFCLNHFLRQKNK